MARTHLRHVLNVRVYVTDTRRWVTQVGLKPVEARTHEELCVAKGLTEEFTGAERTTMLNLLKYIRQKYTGIPEYLVSIGFTEEWQDRLKANFLV